MWETLDKCHENDEFGNLDHYVCDGCEGPIEYPFYDFKCELQFCYSCYPRAVKYLENIISGAEIIDRRDCSVEDKPRVWPCIICGFMLGGGYQWRYYDSHSNNESSTNDCHYLGEMDICMDCSSDIDKMKENLVLCSDDVRIVERVEPVLVSFAKVDNRHVPEALADQVTNKRVELWAELATSIVSIPDMKVFGSYKQWTMFTDFYELPVSAAATALAVDCSISSTNGRIASIVADNHGRVAVDIIFDNIQDYLSGYDEWKANYNREKSKQLWDKFDNDNYDLEYDELAESCAEFSGYIRAKRQLGLYYG